MNLNRYLHAEYLPLPLIAAMVLTRFHHFGDVLHLPDASLAVFFFAGFYRKKMFFAFLLALAGLIDYVAIANGTSSWCVSPAYVFLIPTYAVMWLTGRHCMTLGAGTLNEMARSLGLLLLATSAAFLISNGSFYLFSGRYPDHSWEQYFSRVTNNYPPYLLFTLLYGFAGFALVKLAKTVAVTQERHNTAL